MKKLGSFAVCAMLTLGICLAQDLVNIVYGTIQKVDSTTKTIVVKTADGTEHTIKVTGAATLKGTKDGFSGLTEGT
jgi:VCBS repeat-containing protein